MIVALGDLVKSGVYIVRTKISYFEIHLHKPIFKCQFGRHKLDSICQLECFCIRILQKNVEGRVVAWFRHLWNLTYVSL